MAPEPGQTVAAVPKELRIAAGKWTSAGERLLTASVMAQLKVNLDDSKVGIFHEFYANYKRLSPFVFDRLSEGVAVCGSISAKLETAASIYDKMEQDNSDALGGGR
ncbi:hypothetical protein LTV02_06605 [Nocardia yamanashiensis]|uniref:hypothetical protein n=1 Tax=Nocardia yamanashiensis TaxID=209247 RepID=UPI001E3D68BB|nr:hypothetical protein [Nocardia yamanashiensis]UGT43058.1 hypothetical protein LTV02_06605 [Nocardia yamanashiensis]